MRIVTIGAGVAFAGAFGEVPMAGHAAVRAVPKIARLLSVTLRTQLHRVDEFNRLAIGQSQRVVIAGIVATDATEIAVVVIQSLMKIFQLRSVAQFKVGFGCRVAGGTIHRDWFPEIIFFSRRDARSFRLSNVGRIIGLPAGRDFWRGQFFLVAQLVHDDRSHAGEGSGKGDSGGEIFLERFQISFVFRAQVTCDRLPSLHGVCARTTICCPRQDKKWQETQTDKQNRLSARGLPPAV